MRKGMVIVIGLVVLFVYSGILLGAIPVLGSVWWRAMASHLSGAVAGVGWRRICCPLGRKARAERRAGARSQASEIMNSPLARCWSLDSGVGGDGRAGHHRAAAPTRTSSPWRHR